MERIEKSRVEGSVSIIIGLMKDRILTKESRAKRINMSENKKRISEKGFCFLKNHFLFLKQIFDFKNNKTSI